MPIKEHKGKIVNFITYKTVLYERERSWEQLSFAKQGWKGKVLNPSS